MLLAEGWNSPRATVCMHLAPTASRRVYQQRIGRIMRTAPAQGGRHRRRLRPEGRDAQRARRSRCTRCSTRTSTARARASRRRRAAGRAAAHAGSSRRRRGSSRSRRTCGAASWSSSANGSAIDPKYLDEDEQRFWATIAGRNIRYDERVDFVRKLTEGRASQGLPRAVPDLAAAENPNRRLRLTALADRVSMTVERADFDDLVTLVTQAPTWEKDRLPGIRTLLRAIGEGKAGRAGADPRPLDVAARARDRARRRTAARAPTSRRRSACSARSRTRAGTGTRRTPRRLVNAALAQPLHVGVALLASAEGYTPRANQLIDARPRAARLHPGRRLRAGREPSGAEARPGQVPPPPPPPQEGRRRQQQRPPWPRRTARRARANSLPPNSSRPGSAADDAPAETAA